jgi:hypothetical protein
VISGVYHGITEEYDSPDRTRTLQHTQRQKAMLTVCGAHNLKDGLRMASNPISMQLEAQVAPRARCFLGDAQS